MSAQKPRRTKRVSGNPSQAAGTPKSDGEDEKHCIICTNELHYAALLPCGHTTCHECALRQRALYEKKSCFVCRAEQPRTVFTDKVDASWEDYQGLTFSTSDEKYGIDFTTERVRAETLKLLSNRCPFKQCDSEEFVSFKKLSEHVRKTHEKLYCLICAHHKKAFVSELKLYNQKQLHQHQAKGDEEGFSGHPACKFCTSKRFYSSDELFVHMRSDHEKCHVCDQIDSANPQYFKDYPSLEVHFRAQHYVCTVPRCLEQKFVVFRDDIDLRAHMLKEHQEIVGKNANLLQFGGNDGFGSRLSTFRAPTAPKPLLPKEEAADSIEVRRKRLEERARFYLNNSPEQYAEFRAINSAYDSGSIKASVVQERYRKLFSKSPEADVALLLYDLAKLYPETSERRMQLNAITGTTGTAKSAELDQLFPALPGSSKSMYISGWGSSQQQQKKKQANGELFPQLSAASSRSPSSANIPKVSANKAAKLNVFNPQSSGSSSRSGWSTGTSTPKPRIDSEKFPALEAKEQKKFKPPRVNPVPSGMGDWGANSAGSSSSSLDLNSLGQALEANGKKGKKKKQLLVHYGL